jgi:ribosomal protein L23
MFVARHIAVKIAVNAVFEVAIGNIFLICIKNKTLRMHSYCKKMATTTESVDKEQNPSKSDDDGAYYALIIIFFT